MDVEIVFTLLNDECARLAELSNDGDVIWRERDQALIRWHEADSIRCEIAAILPYRPFSWG